MKHLILALLLPVTFFFTASCQGIGGNNERIVNGVKCMVHNVSPDEFEKKLATPGVQLLDVRTPEEYAEGHLVNSRNLDHTGGVLEQNAHTLDKNRPVLVYCRSGKRSAAAATYLQQQGFKEVYNMKGGIQQWQSAGKPVE
ncbi:hypothetical protein GCM10023093_16390 [Nemorincola caseinilytica]|uniref:Rhodanese domain-containing protein n=1 Tax=Nemorincola caseinilytica TaxID=2054315 RepID=A0ABP8NGC2_9BACT